MRKGGSEKMSCSSCCRPSVLESLAQGPPLSRSVGFWAPGKGKGEAEAQTQTGPLGVAGRVSTLWGLGGPLHSGT